MNARLRYKIPPPEMCVTCYEPRLATDGTDVDCLNCGATTKAEQHGKAVRKFARWVRMQRRRRAPSEGSGQ